MNIKVKGTVAAPKIQTAATVQQAVRMAAEATSGQKPMVKIAVTVGKNGDDLKVVSRD